MKKLLSLPEFVMLSLTFLFCLYGTGFVERVDIEGWDGNGYIYYAKELPRLLQDKEIDKYYLNRFLPSAVVRGMLEIYAAVKGIAVEHFSKATFIQFFSLWSAICVFSAITLLLNAFREFSSKVKWGLWILLVGNFFVLKMTFFYPMLTDITAFLLAAVMLWAYKKEKYFIILLACIAGYFTHPLLFYAGLLLWLFSAPMQHQKTYFSARWNWVITGAVMAAALLKFILVTQHRPEHLREYSGMLLPLSIVMATAYIGFLVYKLNPLQKLQEVWDGIGWKKMAVPLWVWGSLSLFTHYFSNGQPGMTMREFLHYVMYDALTDPAIFLVAHVVYFGPAVLLMIFFFPKVMQTIEKESLGFQLFCWAGLLLSVNSESRQMVIFWPFLIYALSDTVLEKIVEKKYILLLLAVIALVWSKVWLTLQPSPYRLGEVEQFPEQLYFMHQGPWMSHAMYLWQLGMVLLIAILLYAALKFFPSNTDQNIPDSSY